MHKMGPNASYISALKWLGVEVSMRRGSAPIFICFVKKGDGISALLRPNLKQDTYRSIADVHPT